VTIQNFRGQIVGFLNVCSHRATQMRVCGRGNGLLRCPYHGWVYNQSGVPVGIPDNDRLFQLTTTDREALALRSVAVEARGGLLFLRLSDDNPDLDAALSVGSPPHTANPPLLIAEHVTISDQLDSVASGDDRPVIAQNLALDQSQGWSVARYHVPLSAGRTLLGAVLFRSEIGATEVPPESISHLWASLAQEGGS